MDPSLLPLFSPRGIVLIGASHDPGKLGYAVAANLVQSGFPGGIYFVNPRGGQLFDRPVYTAISDLPEPVDLAVLIIPAALIPETLRHCATRGVRAAIVLSGGFREVGPEGAALEAESLRVARESGIRLLGPNCVGIIDTHLPLDCTFLPRPSPIPGDVAFITHSGAICAVVTDWATGLGFGLSRLVSLGNQADLIESDVLEPVAEDPHTRVLTLYLEGIGDGRRFVEEARRVTRRKPVIALKVGRSAGGQRAVSSHTGALAGREDAYDAAFARAGVFRAQTSEEMFDWSRALAWCPLPQGSEVAVLTNAGGPGVIAADAVEHEGLRLADLQETTRAVLQEFLPPVASVRNPVDILASATPEQYARSLRLLLDDPGVHAVLVIIPPPPRDPAEAVTEALIPVIRAATKPVVIALMGENLVRRAAEQLRAARVPDYRCPERAGSALAVLVRRAELLARPERSAVTFGDVSPENVRRVLAGLPPGQTLDHVLAGQILAEYGMHSLPIAQARTADEAVTLAEEMGFPVALKAASPDLPHRSDVGGVLLNVPDGAAVSAGFARLVRRVKRARPDASVLGVQVQRMAPPGQEVIVGVVQDPQFGPLLMFGSGGVEVEGLRDVAFALAPLAREDAEELVGRTWAGRKLRGYRSLPPADVTAVVDVVLRLGQLAVDFPELSEIEINPLRVLPAGQGAVAVDVRAQIAALPSATLRSTA